MGRFNNAWKSHEHSLQVLNLLAEHDSFIESISTVADMGCGSGLDIEWWASRETRDDAPVELNLQCYAVDKTDQHLQPTKQSNIVFIKNDFERRVLPKTVDVIWCHDAFQYALNPVNTLKLFNEQMNENGLLYIGIPLHNNMVNNRWSAESRSYEYFPHTFLSLVYMLAVNGFDCKDAYFRKAKNDPWLHAAVFKSNIKPMNPSETSWHDLVTKGLLNPSMQAVINQSGYPMQQHALYPWLDKENYRIEV